MVAQTACPKPEYIRELLRAETPSGGRRSSDMPSVDMPSSDTPSRDAASAESSAEHDRLAGHLDRCPDCRERFDLEVAESDAYLDVALVGTQELSRQDAAVVERLLLDLPRKLSDAAHAAAMETSSNETIRDFLEPSDVAGHLGRLGPYELVEFIGRGGMGIVLRGIDTKLNRVVAVKILAPEFASNANARRRFFREAQAAAAVSHDHVVTIHAVDDGHRLPYLVMEYVAGESLEECIHREGMLQVEQVLRIGRQAALGLAAAHQVGLIHRDMKPANILLENGIQKVRITDFGLARAVDDVAITQTGVVSGTPLFMAPEQARGESMDHRTDLFSLGSVLYTMCTGRPPFRANTTVGVLKRVCEDSPRPVSEINPQIPEPLVTLIQRLMAKTPDDRIQSAEQVAEILAGQLAEWQQGQPDRVTQAKRATQEERAARAWRAQEPKPRATYRRWLMPLVLLGGIGTVGVTDAVGLTGVSQFLGVVLRLNTPEGTLVVEIEDPEITVRVDGDEVVLNGAGVHELRLKPGQHRWRAERGGAVTKSSWVSIDRNGKTIIRVRREAPQSTTSDAGKSRPDSPAASNSVAANGPTANAVVADSQDGVVFESPQATRRLTGESIVVVRGGEYRFDRVPAQLWGQRWTGVAAGDGWLKFSIAKDEKKPQRLWLLVPHRDWPAHANTQVTYDTAQSLMKRGWHAWETLTSRENLGARAESDGPESDPDPAEAGPLKWSVFYRDSKPGDTCAVRTHSTTQPMLVWGSIDLGGIEVRVQWDQRAAVFKPGATIPLGNGDHRFDTVPEFLDGCLYTKRNGYEGIVRFRVTRAQRVSIGLYDWAHMNDGNASGGWREELTSREALTAAGWEHTTTLQGTHTVQDGLQSPWTVYSRDCKAGEEFAIRNHKYQAPIVFSERVNRDKRLVNWPDTAPDTPPVKVTPPVIDGLPARIESE